MSERLYDLLIARATVGLSSSESVELAALLGAADPRDVASMEATLARLGQAFESADAIVVDEPLPAPLRERLLADVPPAATLTRDGTSAPRIVRGDADAVIAKLRVISRLGWIVAAASIVLAAAIVLTRPAPVVPADLIRIVDAAGDVIRLPFTPQADGPAAATGVVVWSDTLQRGYVQLNGLPANDPTLKQYQLWVVDPGRAAQPIDAGVFDAVDANGVAMPFGSKLPVKTPAAFAITSEKPGGVVVTQGPLLLVAPNEANAP